MSHAEQLREVFADHEHLAPDGAAVSAGALHLARGYRRRRWAARAAGGAVVTAGLATAAVGLPGVLDGGRATTEQTAPFAAAPVPPPAAPVDLAEQQRDAYFAAGYDYDDAVELARLWGLGDATELDVKAEAGRRLLAGGTLPLAPGAAPAAPAPAAPDLDDALGDGRYIAFLEAGYDWDDAVTLARLWETSDVLQAKAVAGQRLLDGQSLPFAP